MQEWVRNYAVGSWVLLLLALRELSILTVHAYSDVEPLTPTNRDGEWKILRRTRSRIWNTIAVLVLSLRSVFSGSLVLTP